MQGIVRTRIPKSYGLPSSAPVPTSGARILAVDDDDRNLTAICEVLGDTGEIVCAKSGEEALRWLLKEEFAVILLDVLMPGMDGYETAALIRQREQSRRTPIIFLTAINKEQAHMLRGYDAGAVDFVFKPFDPFILRSKVRVFVDLFDKTQEIQRRAAAEQNLLQAALDANAEKLEAERSLRRSEQRQEAILRSLPICFHARSATPPYAAHFVSAAAERLTGFPTERFTSDPEFGLSRVHPEDLPAVKQALVSTLERGSYATEFRWLCADDTYRVFLDEGVIARDSESGEPELYGTLTDITERRQLEERLMHSQRLDAIGKLTGGLAHDFNNLLAAILSGLGLIGRRAKLGDDATRILEMTRRSATQGADLVNRMLAFSRRQQLRPAAVSIDALADTLKGLIAPVLGGLIEFEWSADTEVWAPHADAAQLELAVMNLIFNARDAMPSGGKILVKARNEVVEKDTDDISAGDYVVIAVSDSGSGIPPEILSKVIEPFFTTKSVGKGTGLGLSTVYGFARQSRGMLKLDSVVDQGTSAELWLPRSEEPVPSGPSAEDVQDLLETDGARSLSILLVDDSANLRELTARSLSDRGFSVTTAGGGVEALAIIESDPHKFDVIVTDFAMPAVTGLDVVRFARKLRSDCPAIIITGYADAAAVDGRPEDVPLLVKPFSETELIQRIVAAGKSEA